MPYIDRQTRLIKQSLKNGSRYLYKPASDEKREIQRRLLLDFIWFLTQVGSAIELLHDQSLFNAQLD